METGCLQLTPRISESRAHLWGDLGPRQDTIHIEHSESNAFHVECANRDGERFAFGDERLAHLAGELV